MQEYVVEFQGRMPLVIHNIRLANPLDPYAKAMKAISSKRAKTEDDILELVRLEWEGGLYFDSKTGPYVPVSYPSRCLRDAGAITRHKTALTRGLTIMADDGSERCSIEYDGPRTIDEMWDDDQYRLIMPVRVNSARTLRARPQFPEWRLRFRATIDTELVDPGTFEAVCFRAGRNIGIGESPFGTRARFDVTLTELATEGATGRVEVAA